MFPVSAPYPPAPIPPRPQRPPRGAAPLVAVEDLCIRFAAGSGIVTAVEGLSFKIEPGETLAMVGESGSGKSVTALALLGLLPRPAERLSGGRIAFAGQDLAHLSGFERRRLRGTEIGMVFQEPMTSLNPVLTVGEQIAERLRAHGGLDRRQAARRAVEMLERVRIPEAHRRVRDYPHRLSGGMRQRVVIAMALACDPRLLIADEPTTALDVTIQAQILDLMLSLQAESGMAILFITHDLGLVAEMADDVLVMYAGRAVEQAPVRELFAHPRMPYTRALLHAIPRPDRGLGPDLGVGPRPRLKAIGGHVPDPFAAPPGCAFQPRCTAAQTPCATAMPALEDSGAGHLVRCRRFRELAG